MISLSAKYLASILIAVCVFTLMASGQMSGFNDRVWLDKKYPLLLDPYGPNKVELNDVLKDERIAGMIHQATVGLRKGTDSAKFEERAGLAAKHGLLFGSYHMGTNADPIAQADFYLKVIGKYSSWPMALDIEDLGKNDISLHDAEIFIKRIHDKTGRYPLVYVNNVVFNAIDRRYDSKSIFAKCPLWYARFIPDYQPLSNKVWKKVTIWQFASEINCQVCLARDGDGECTRYGSGYTSACPYKIAGTEPDIDIDVFNGTLDELKSFWQR